MRSCIAHTVNRAALGAFSPAFELASAQPKSKSTTDCTLLHALTANGDKNKKLTQFQDFVIHLVKILLSTNYRQKEEAATLVVSLQRSAAIDAELFRSYVKYPADRGRRPLS